VLVPLLPVIVRVNGALVAKAGFSVEIFSVELPPAVTELGVKLALTFDGRAEMLNATELLPPISVVFTVTVPLEPRFTVRDVGDTEIPKSAAGVTVSDTVVVCVPPFPLMVMVKGLPAKGVLAVVVIVSVELPGAVTEFELSAQVVPAGHPDTVNPTALLKPPIEPTVMVEVLTCPCAALTDDGLAESEKSGGG
jgi:hypothetical protein